MRISAKCTTYGRCSYLEEAIYSFINQENLDNAEMVVVNDYPLQTLVYNHPNVRMYNLDKTFDCLGDKENFAIEKCRGDIIAVWDDDDVALPHHLNNIRKYWKKDTNILHWNGVYYNYPEITALVFIGNSGMVYSKKAWEMVGKSPIMNAGGDTALMHKIHALGEEYVVIAEPSNEELSWFYRWHLLDENRTGVYHQSGIGDDFQGRPNIVQRHCHYIEEQRIKGKIPTGVIHLHPHWSKNYTKMLKDYNENNLHPPQ